VSYVAVLGVVVASSLLPMMFVAFRIDILTSTFFQLAKSGERFLSSKNGERTARTVDIWLTVAVAIASIQGAVGYIIRLVS